MKIDEVLNELSIKKLSLELELTTIIKECINKFKKDTGFQVLQMDVDFFDTKDMSDGGQVFVLSGVRVGLYVRPQNGCL